MAIKDRIQKISSFFREMQISTVDGESVIYVVVEFPYNWVIDDDIEKKFDVQITNGTNPNEYYFYTSIENGEDRIFDAIEYNISKMKEAIERATLLSKKTLELKALFEDETISLEQLRNLKIMFPTGLQAHVGEEKEPLPLVLPKNKKKQSHVEVKEEPSGQSSDSSEAVYDGAIIDNAESANKAEKQEV